jgi:Tfp pilus assembly protein PilF
MLIDAHYFELKLSTRAQARSGQGRFRSGGVEEVSGCSVCGSSLIAGRCLPCDTRRWSRFVHRELVLLTVLVSATVAAFFGTRAVAQGNEALRRRQAAAWYEAAQRASLGGDAESAAAALRRAVSKDRGSRQYRLALADALTTRGLDGEARRALLALRETEPEDAETNLRLARLEARASDEGAARRYYQNALSSLWRPEQAEERRRMRIELIEFLLAHQQRARALSELLLVAANLPEDAAIQAQVGRMFLAAGDPRLALDHFVSAVRLDSGNAHALAGAGEAAFELGEYSRALRYLKGAARDDAHATKLREVAQLVLNNDPLAPRIGASERRRRLLAAFEQVSQRLDDCLSGPLVSTDELAPVRDELREVESAVRRPGRREPRDLIDDGVDLVYRIERAAEQACRVAPAPFDRALLLIGRRHGLEEQ